MCDPAVLRPSNECAMCRIEALELEVQRFKLLVEDIETRVIVLFGRNYPADRIGFVSDQPVPQASRVALNF